MFCPGAPRPRNAKATRAAILDAALERFARGSYDDVGVRDIARDVGVDAALVSRYFGSKEELFTAVLDSCATSSELTQGERADFGRRVARAVIFDSRKKQTKLKGLLIMLRSVSSTKTTELVQRAGSARFFDPFSAWVGGEDAAVRARLAAAFVMGMAVSREITGSFGLTKKECELMEGRMAAILQDIIDG